MTKYIVLLSVLFFASISANASTATPDILASVSSDQVSLLTMQEMADTRGERVSVSAAIRICEALNLSFCEVSLDVDAELVSMPIPLPFGLGIIYLQQ